MRATEIPAVRRRWKAVPWVVLGVVLGAGWVPVSDSAPLAHSPLVQTAVVRKALDGDTVELVSGERVRYLGIDTPELYRHVGTEWVLRPEPYAKEALAYNQRAVEGRVVRLEFDAERRDRFRRTLAYVYQGERFINAELVARGLARPLTIPPNTRFAGLFASLARDARVARLGLWSVERDAHPTQE